MEDGLHDVPGPGLPRPPLLGPPPPLVPLSQVLAVQHFIGRLQQRGSINAPNGVLMLTHIGENIYKNLAVGKYWCFHK